MKTMIGLMLLGAVSTFASTIDSKTWVSKSAILIKLAEGVETQHGMECDPYRINVTQNKFTAQASCGFIGHAPDEYDLELKVEGTLITTEVFVDSVRFEYDY